MYNLKWLLIIFLMHSFTPHTPPLQATAEAFFIYLIIFFETVCFYTIFGQFLVYITPNAGVAQVIGGMFNFLFNIFSES